MFLLTTPRRQASTFPRQHQRQQEGARDLLYYQSLARGVEQQFQEYTAPGQLTDLRSGQK
jgi:hypothetical protein